MTRVRRRLAGAVAICTSGCGVLVSIAAIAAGSALAAIGPARSVANCVPEPQYQYCQRFSYAGSDQWFTVPGGVHSIKVLAWGAGGGGAPPARAAVASRLYLPAIGWGGGRSGAASGGNGQAVIEWGHRSHRPRHWPRPAPTQGRRPHPGRSLAPSPAPAEQVLPLTGFPFLQVGVVAVVLIGLGAVVTWAGGRDRQS